MARGCQKFRMGSDLDRMEVLALQFAGAAAAERMAEAGRGTFATTDT